MLKIYPSQTPPSNINVAWLDVSTPRKLLKVFTNGEWISINDESEAIDTIKAEIIAAVEAEVGNLLTKEEAAELYATITVVNNKVDKVTGKGLSTEDYTTADKNKLAGIAEGANKTIVDTSINVNSVNPVQNKVIANALNSKASTAVFNATTNGLVPKGETTLAKATAALNANGEWFPTLNTDTSQTKGYVYAAPKEANGKPTFRALTADDLPEDIKVSVLDLLTYGISWKKNVADPDVTRIGNMNYHRTLPIQSNMKGCIAQMLGDNKRIMYFLDDDDWRFREPKNAKAHVLLQQEVTKDIDLLKVTNSVFSTKQYEHQYVRINGIVAKVTSVDTASQTATLESESTIDAGVYNIQLGAVLNGYDGEVMVLVPEFWIKSVDTETDSEVRISPTKIDDTWEHQPTLLVAAYHDTVLNTVPSDMGYLSLLPVNSLISVVNVNSYCRGGGNRASFDEYLATAPARTDLGKPRSSMPRSTMRAYARNAGKEIISYLQWKRAILWLPVIEYATFNMQQAYNKALDANGFHQGGLSEGVTNVNLGYWGYFNGHFSLTPNGYTNELGNKTGYKEISITYPTASGAEPTSTTVSKVIRYRGIENIFGDIWNNVDGIIIDSSSVVTADGVKYSEVYATDNPADYGDSETHKKKMRVVGLEYNSAGGNIKEFDLGNTAEIIPRAHAGNNNQYKCDNHWQNSATGLRTLFLGGLANYGGVAGLGGFSSYHGVGDALAYLGCRSSCVLA